MDKLFKLKDNKTTVSTEIIAGMTTFFTMAYIIIVNPNILGDAGMPWGGVFIATVLSAVVGTLIMGLWANIPYAQAPAMGLNAFFAYTICAQLGFVWQEALAMVFICGLLNMLLTVTSVRKNIIKSIPESLRNAISGGIGMFVAYIGFNNAGFIDFGAVPSLAAFSNAGVLLTLIGLVFTVVLLLLNVKGAIFIGIIATTLIGIPMGVVDLSSVTIFDVSGIGEIKSTFGALFGSPGFGTLFTSPQRVFISLTAVFAFSLSDIFDTIGTFIGTGRISGIFDDTDEKALMGGKGFKSKMEKGLFADMVATTAGAVLGTSNVTTYVESASGIAIGGRTGLTSTVTAILFLLCLPFAGLFGVVPMEAAAPALIVVGIMMMSSIGKVKWDDFEEAIPCFFTVIIMVLAYNISYGIAAGFIFYCIVKLCRNKLKEVHPILIGASVLFIINFVIIALRDIGKI